MNEFEQAIYEAIHETIETMGLEAFKATSWFGSNKRLDSSVGRA